MSTSRYNQGFTLVEMIVSIGIFTIVLFIATSSFLAVVNADKKSRATRTAMDNLTVALEDMSRRIKTGTVYTCDGTVSSTAPQDCNTGTSFAFTDQDGKRVAYRVSGGQIIRTTQGESAELSVTAPEINISNLSFVVGGATPGDNTQPYVRIKITGSTTGGVINSGFTMQTMVTQRMYDF